MLSKKITEDYIQAMKSRNTEKAQALNFLRAQIKNVMVDKRVTDLDDADVITVIKKQVKQRHDSIAQYEQGGRADLAAKERFELGLLKEYLPQEMSAEELRPIVEQTVAEVGASGMKDMGAVMKALMPKVAGKADNKTVSELVKNVLSTM
ncbi:MAG TPA: GatB/YqeY domain-containing protein [Candidatus Omnitrophota bacterium]|nr:GatB/YqeY domain-containing protein [Candidatus Omnitrophota bacterium]HSA31127.1 GatB/YqeY domain-containing protein [Candidatus Omnitrophota bacterium]